MKNIQWTRIENRILIASPGRPEKESNASILTSTLNSMEAASSGLGLLWSELKTSMDSLEALQDDLHTAKGNVETLRAGASKASASGSTMSGKKRNRLDEYSNVIYKVARK